MWKSERTNCSAASPSSFCFRSYLRTKQTEKELAQPQLASPARQRGAGTARPVPLPTQPSALCQPSPGRCARAGHGLCSPVPHHGRACPYGTTANAAGSGQLPGSPSAAKAGSRLSLQRCRFCERGSLALCQVQLGPWRMAWDCRAHATCWDARAGWKDWRREAPTTPGSFRACTALEMGAGCPNSLGRTRVVQP